MDLVALLLFIRWIAAVLAVLLAIHLVAVWMERRGWIYYRKTGRRGYGIALSNALAEFDAVLNPASEHRVVEERHLDAMRYAIDISDVEGENPEPDQVTDPAGSG